MEHIQKEGFHSQLRKKADDYVRSIYKLTRSFPKEELYGITSQVRRAALSVALNLIEGYGRGSKTKSFKNFLHIAYGSLKESQYLLDFSFQEKFLEEHWYKSTARVGDEIGAMLWGIIQKL